MGRPASNLEIVRHALENSGFPANQIFRTVLLKDRYFVGHKYHFLGGSAVWVAGAATIDVFDGQGGLVGRVPIPGAELKPAA